MTLRDLVQAIPERLAEILFSVAAIFPPEPFGDIRQWLLAAFCEDMVTTNELAALTKALA